MKENHQERGKDEGKKKKDDDEKTHTQNGKRTYNSANVNVIADNDLFGILSIQLCPCYLCF